MTLTLYLIICIFFLVGGIGIFFTNRKKEKPIQKKNWIKYLIYFLIVTTLCSIIFFFRQAFPFICILISAIGYFEIINLNNGQKPFRRRRFFIVTVIYAIFSVLFYLFAYSSKEVLLFTLFTVCSFDAFCQITGQLFGKKKICPSISPNKTYEGLIGGTIASIGTSYLIGNILSVPSIYSLTIGLGICLFAFGGDLLASRIKRLYNVKDFSRSLPGHGGILDRFDSLISSGSFVYMFNIIWAF